ncbi:YwaF family protein [Tenuibacillus multivorans]|uniref:Conserved hypothetical integral membrane protein TIGR02206 n=1 Tax=Tenuibacillus multivorans TaxID=237069 RepID=A0A1H0DT06_9BACI|nr:TIGR02206 family membrane protein [Tenuibacillus multivorans]GEL76788.1 permease [Tenuibacillus multivorans]SDN73302.1 conserved hypothetical integral membrane protein TIGR02206 [Tenuibacillus multivorans]
MESLFGFNIEKYPFELFSFSHFLMIVILLIMAVLMYVFRQSFKEKKTVKYILIAVLITSAVSYQLWFLLNGQWDIKINLPLQLCSISLYLCTFMLLSKSYRLFEITFFVSMSGAFLAIVTPELFFGFPHFRFFQFFIAHMVIVLSCLYMLWVEEFRPTFMSVIRSFIVLNVIAVFVFIINKLIGSNYMFLVEKPSNTSIIDYLGPYPWYILSLEAVAFALFILIYLVIYLLRKNKRG